MTVDRNMRAAYSDMLRNARRCRGSPPRAAMRSPAANHPRLWPSRRRPRQLAKPGKRRLSFHESTRSRTCRGASPAWRRASATCAERLDDPTCNARDRQVFPEVSASLAAAQSELAAAEEVAPPRHPARRHRS